MGRLLVTGEANIDCWRSMTHGRQVPLLALPALLRLITYTAFTGASGKSSRTRPSSSPFTRSRNPPPDLRDARMRLCNSSNSIRSDLTFLHVAKISDGAVR